MTETQTDISPAEARAALEWLIAMGADEIVSETATDRFSAAPPAQKVEAKAKIPAAAPNAPQATVVSAAAKSVETKPARNCATIADLETALLALEDCPLKRTASNLCFAGGNINGHTMVIGDVAGREEDLEGAPFAGQSAALLERMLGAIGLSSASQTPEQAVSLFNLIPWRPPGQRPPTESEVAQCLPFLIRAIEIVQPRALLCFGALPAQALLGRSDSLMTMRGKWFELNSAGRSIPLITTYAPRLLLQQRAQKRLAWRDLLSLQEKMKDNG